MDFEILGAAKMRGIVLASILAVAISGSIEHEKCFTQSNLLGFCQLREHCSTTSDEPSPTGSSVTNSEAETLGVVDESGFHHPIKYSDCPSPKICCPKNSNDETDESTTVEVPTYPINEELENEQENRFGCEDQNGGCSQERHPQDENSMGSSNSNSSFLGLSLSDEKIGVRSGAFGDAAPYRRISHSGRKNSNPSFESQAFLRPIESKTEISHLKSDASISVRNILPSSCGLQDTITRISRGQAVHEGELPWMVALQYHTPEGKESACGGSLISNRYVLTAAHCVTGVNIPSTWQLREVRLGTTERSPNPVCKKKSSSPWSSNVDCTIPNYMDVPIERMIVHFNYDGHHRNKFNDIALLKLVKDVEFSKTVKPICLPSSLEINKNLTVAGWGLTENGKPSSKLLKARVPLVSCELKNTRKIDLLGSSQVCAGGNVQDTCSGDSGGPLMETFRLGAVNAYRIVGITSFGYRFCGTIDWPAVYTRVYSFMPWILSNIELSLHISPRQRSPVVTYKEYSSRHLLPQSTGLKTQPGAN